MRRRPQSIASLAFNVASFPVSEYTEEGWLQSGREGHIVPPMSAALNSIVDASAHMHTSVDVYTPFILPPVTASTSIP